MPCYVCGARQTDPARGPSAWKRGVRGGVQVLVCPDCQRDPDWTAGLDRCPGCGSTALLRKLGETHCRSCPVVVPDVVTPAAPAATDPGLAAEVAAALDRLRSRG